MPFSWSSITDAAESAVNAGRLEIAVLRDVYREHFLGEEGDNVYRLAQRLDLPVDQETARDLTREYIADSPGLSEAIDTFDEAKEALRDALPPGPWWAWAIGGVFVLGVGVVVAAKLLR